MATFNRTREISEESEIASENTALHLTVVENHYGEQLSEIAASLCSSR